MGIYCHINKETGRKAIWKWNSFDHTWSYHRHRSFGLQTGLIMVVTLSMHMPSQANPAPFFPQEGCLYFSCTLSSTHPPPEEEEQTVDGVSLMGGGGGGGGLQPQKGEGGGDTTLSNHGANGAPNWVLLLVTIRAGDWRPSRQMI